MENKIYVVYSKLDNDINNDLTGVTCYKNYNGRDQQLVGYGGETANELIKIITRQGYLQTLLDNQKKPETGFVNKVCVHFQDGNMEQDCVYLNATDIVLDNPEYLMFTTNDHKQIYFNKKDIVYFEMWGDQG